MGERVDVTWCQFQGHTAHALCALCGAPAHYLAQGYGPRRWNAPRAPIGPSDPICYDCVLALGFTFQGAPACYDERRGTGVYGMPCTPRTRGAFGRLPLPTCPRCGHATVTDGTFCGLRGSDSIGAWLQPVCPCCGEALAWGDIVERPVRIATTEDDFEADAH